MADGAILETKNYGFTNKAFLHQLIDGATAPDSGVWIDAREILEGVLEFYDESGTGSVTFSAQIMGSNSLSKPEPTTDGFALGSAVTTLGSVQLPGLARWIKVNVESLSVSGGGTLGVRMHSLTH